MEQSELDDNRAKCKRSSIDMAYSSNVIEFLTELGGRLLLQIVLEGLSLEEMTKDNVFG